MCFRHRSKFFISNIFCPNQSFSTEHSKLSQILDSCGPVDEYIANKECAKQNIRAAKVIRLCSLRELKNLAEDENIDVKVSLVSQYRIVSNVELIDNLRITKPIELGEFVFKIKKGEFN